MNIKYFISKINEFNNITFKGHEDVVKMLIDHGADLSIMDNDGNNSIHRAVLSGQISIATILLHKRPDLQNMKNGKNLSLTEIALNKGIILPS